MTLVADYRPSEPTGWPWTPGRSLCTTVGGHVTAVEFVVEGRPFRVALLALDGSGDPFGPRYEGRPSPDFTAVLDRACGEHYAFRYVDGFPGRAELRIRSHSVFATQCTAETRFGADLHLVYEPDVAHGDPPADDAMRWIQVVRRDDGEAELDRAGPANPFYPYGGRTSVEGVLVVNFQGLPQVGVRGTPSPRGLFTAETFLARDTGRRDHAGRGTVEIFGGVRWGWEAAFTPDRRSR